MNINKELKIKYHQEVKHLLEVKHHKKMENVVLLNYLHLNLKIIMQKC